MLTQQDIYAAGSENHPPMLNKENYVPWSSRLLRYAKSRPNGKLIYNSIINGPYVRRMIPEPGDLARTVHTILLGLPEDIYAAVDSCETAQEIWLRVQQMMKGSDIGIQEKKAKLFNEWERFTSTDGESIESYYHRFSKLMNDFKRNKHFPEKIASILKFLNNLQPEWSRHVTIIHQTKDLHTADYTQLYDFLKYNQKEVDDLRAERLTKTQDPLALMANSNNPFNYPMFHPDLPSSSTYIQQPQPNNNYNPQSSFNQNYMQQPLPNPEDIIDPTTAMNMTLIAQPGMNMGQDRQMQMVGGNGGNQFRQYDGQNVRNQNGYNAIQNVGNQNPNGNGNVVAARAEGNANGNIGNQIRCYNCRGFGHLARNYTVRPRRLQKIVSQLTILGEIITLEELNLKFLRSLPTEWGHSSTNDVNTANVHVSTGSTPVSTASTNNSTACLSDATVYAYLATQPNGSQVVHEDLEQIHEDDLDEMDLKWQLALLKKVECFNCHKLGHFARECRNPKSQENRNISQDSSRRTVNVEESSSKAMLAIDGTGFDWSYMADEEASTNFALMAFSDSKVQNNKTCSKTCLKIFEDLKSKYDKLRIELNKSESDLDSYKKGLASVEEQLVFYKKNESMLCDQIAVLKRDASFNESDINALKKQKGLGYNVVPPPLTGLFAPPSIDLSNSRLEKFKQPKFEGYGVKVNKGASENVSKEVKKTLDAP
ncbi:retrovirus-related pol polyprotein from transposon TNT 1-94 [Tanacetum coccineum]